MSCVSLSTTAVSTPSGQSTKRNLRKLSGLCYSFQTVCTCLDCPVLWFPSSLSFETLQEWSRSGSSREQVMSECRDSTGNTLVCSECRAVQCRLFGCAPSQSRSYCLQVYSCRNYRLVRDRYMKLILLRHQKQEWTSTKRRESPRT